MKSSLEDIFTEVDITNLSEDEKTKVSAALAAKANARQELVDGIRKGTIELVALEDDEY